MGIWGPFLILFLILLNSFSSLAATLDYQTEVARAQEWVNQAQTSYPIVIVDRDELQFLFLTQRVLGRENRNVRQEMLAHYFEEKYNLDNLSSYDLSNIDDYIVGYTSLASALPLTENFSNSNPTYKACMVFPRGPNGNKQTEIERTLYMDLPGAYEHSYHQLSSNLSYEELYLFSLYHEASHCLDPKYIPSSMQNESTHDTHLAEAFAETLAYFKLLERFTSDIAFSRAQLRALYTQYVGPNFARQDSQTLPHPKMALAGVIYFLSPYLVEAHESLTDQKLQGFLAPKNLEDLIPYTVNLIDKTSSSSRNFMARATAQRVGFSEAKIIYSNYAENDPDLFQDAYESVLEFEKQLALWTHGAFQKSSEITPNLSRNSPKTRFHLQWDTLCRGLYQKDFTTFQLGLNQIRESLYKIKKMDTASKETYANLDNLPGSANKICWEDLDFALKMGAREN